MSPLRLEPRPEPTGKIAPQPWMAAPATVAVMTALAAGGKPARFVGGCVRDALARQPVGDVDIATPEPPERVMELLAEAGIKTVPTGLKHGTVTAVVQRRPFEITTLRVDVETDGRHAKVAFTDDWTADAARRDFTINAMSCSADGDVFDPFGGIADLAEGRVRFVGEPRRRIEEDVLRILRFFRFQARYGQPPADVDALEACRTLAHLLPTLSGERVRAELFKILLAPGPADSVQLMIGTGIFRHLLPEVADVGRLRVAAWLESDAMRIAGIAPDALRRFAAALRGDGLDAKALADRLRLSNHERERLAVMAAPPFTVAPEMSRHEVSVLLHCHGPQAVRDVALLAWAGERATGPRAPHARSEAWMEILAAADGWSPKRLPVKGDDIRGLGVPPGPQVGKLLRETEQWWIAGDFEASREACLAFMRNRLEFGGQGDGGRGA